MIDVIITSYKEPNSTLRAVNVFLKDKRKDLRIIVVDPFLEVQKFLKSKIKDKRFFFFLDPGEGKSYALDLLFQEYSSENKKDIFILTDGDVYVSDNALNEIINAFEDEKIGCVTGKPVSLDFRETKYGYWSHFLFSGIDKARTKLSNKKKFFECSGYLFAIRKGVILNFPLEASEDSIIPYLFWKKRYKIKYLPKAEVYVKNPDNWKDWLAQKIRNVKGHENLDNLAPDMPRTKSFFNEIAYGGFFLFNYPKNLKEFWWTIELYFARLYLYIKAFKELRKNKNYSDGWRGQAITESTKTLD
jgi:cellulose synthase/poly-beta-1,6-N-acetylglucosamine synthase-like glycosyltransferase